MTEAPAPPDTVLRLTPDEVAVLRVALRMLRATLGRDEADELAEVQALLRRLETEA
jgi:predicted DNA-binding transcriptional regulator YafY